MSEKQDYVDMVADGLGLWRSQRAAILPEHDQLSADLDKLPVRTLRGLDDMLGMVSTDPRDWEKWARRLAARLETLLGEDPISGRSYEAAEETLSDYERMITDYS